MSALHQAYRALGLEPGNSFEAIKRRYRRLVMVWHPDRMQNEDGRGEAEEELKKINHAFDTLRNHFERHHRPGPDCKCQPGTAQTADDRQRSGTRNQEENADEEHRRRYEDQRRREEEAMRREEERRHQAEAAAREEAARKADQARCAAESARQASLAAARQKQLLEEEAMRWRVALAGGAAAAAIVLLGWLGTAARESITDIQRHWTSQSPQTPTSPGSKSPPAVSSVPPPPSADDPDHPYIPMQYRVPGGNPTSWRQFMDDEARKQKQREEDQQKQDIYFTKLAIDRNQRTIDHCTTTIAELEAKIADPGVSVFEKSRLRDYRDFQQSNLENAQRELVAAQDKLKRLEG